MRRPPTMDEAEKRGLLELDRAKAAHTFSNGEEGYGWMDNNCHGCAFFDKECMGGLCAFEGAAQMHCASADLLRLFGWTESTEYPGSFHAPETCAFFREREKGDNGEDIPLPPPPDPTQLILIADPTEDLAQFPDRLAPVEAAVEHALVGAVSSPLPGEP